jgi:hypothetical protein
MVAWAAQHRSSLCAVFKQKNCHSKKACNQELEQNGPAMAGVQACVVFSDKEWKRLWPNVLQTPAMSSIHLFEEASFLPEMEHDPGGQSYIQGDGGV